MSQREPVWRIISRTTGKTVTAYSYLTKEQAENQIGGWYTRHWRGGRPDITLEMLDDMVAKEFPAGVYPEND